MTDTSGKIKSLIEIDKTPEGLYGRWKDEVIKAEKEFENFRRQGRDTVRRFKDERDAIDKPDRKFNIFTANVGIMQSSLYAKIPKVKVSRRFGQANDDVARVAGMILQNAIMQDIDEPECDFDQVMRDAVEDRLVPGMGVAWLRLETDTEEHELEEQLDPLTGQLIQEASTYESISRQEVIIDHVFWEDFLYSPCRTWKERRWVGRRVYMDQDELCKRFGDDIGKQIPLDYNPKGETARSNEPQNELLQKAIIYEIWDRQKRDVLWLSKGFPKLLDQRSDPLGLEDFEPCPKPLFALTTTSNCIAINDFVICQDQYDELDLINNRISLLVQAVKVVGCYDSAATGVQRMLQQGSENTLVPVDNWAMFAEKGGIKGAVDWLPLDSVIQALEKLRQSRDDIKGQIYELTGISDIVRGNTKASETLGAQQIKAQFASVRIQKLQDEVARFAQDILRLKGEILCRHVVPEQLIKMANMEFYLEGGNAPLLNAAVELLKGDHERFEWRVKVQADSLAQADYALEKQEKVEFTNAIATFLQSAATTMKAIPETAPIIFEALKFTITGFKGAQELEGVIDSTLDTIMQKIQNPPPPPPDPAVEKAKVDIQVAQQKAQMDAQSKQMDMQIKQQGAQTELQMAREKNQQELQMAQMEFDLKVQQSEAEFNLKMQQLQQQHGLDLQIAEQEQAFAEDKARRDALEQEINRNADREHEMQTREEDRAFQEKLHKEKLAQAAKPKTATTSSGKTVTVE
jgi:hypothetical protein